MATLKSHFLAFAIVTCIALSPPWLFSEFFRRSDRHAGHFFSSVGVGVGVAYGVRIAFSQTQ